VQSDWPKFFYDDECHIRPIYKKFVVQYEDQSIFTVGNFAQALQYVDILMRKMRAATEEGPPDPPDKLVIDRARASREGCGIIEPEKAEEAGQPRGHVRAA
jgi:hypothetical protein